MVCVGLSHAIFVSLVDGGGFDSVPERDWLPPDDDDDDDDDGITGAGGPVAELYAAGFDGRDDDDDGTDRLRATMVARGPLRSINRLARRLDVRLGEAVASPTTTTGTTTTIAAMVSVSSEPVVVHRASLCSCRRVDVPG